MAHSKDNAADTATIPAIDPFELKDPAAAPEPLAAASETPRIGLLRRIGFGRTATAEAEADAAAEPPAPKARPLADFFPRQLPLAAAVVLALALGGLIGAGATLSLQRDNSSEALTALAGEASRDQAFASATQQLQDSVARLRAEVAALKTGIDQAQRSAGTQFTRLSDGLARVEQRQVSLAAAPTVTGSIGPVTAVAKQEPKADPKTDVKPEANQEPKADSKPSLAEGWRLLDYYAGRAVVETPAGRLFDVGAGSNLPGLGRVQSIKREDGRIVLTARNGTVAGIVDQRRTPYYRHYR